MKNQQEYDEIMKFIIIGDAKVGKTSIIKSFCRGVHNNNEPPTHTLDYDQKIMIISGKKILFQIWDTAVNQNFRLLLPSLYSSVMGILLIFSVDNRNSFNSIAVWMKQIQSFAVEGIPIILMCNKADLNKKQVSQREAQALSEALEIDMVMISAKNKINIQQTMIKMYQKKKKQANGKNEKKNKKQNQSFSILKCNF